MLQFAKKIVTLHFYFSHKELIFKFQISTFNSL